MNFASLNLNIDVSWTKRVNRITLSKLSVFKKQQNGGNVSGVKQPIVFQRHQINSSSSSPFIPWRCLQLKPRNTGLSNLRCGKPSTGARFKFRGWISTTARFYLFVISLSITEASTELKNAQYKGTHVFSNACLAWTRQKCTSWEREGRRKIERWGISAQSEWCHTMMMWFCCTIVELEDAPELCAENLLVVNWINTEVFVRFVPQWKGQWQWSHLIRLHFSSDLQILRKIERWNKVLFYWEAFLLDEILCVISSWLDFL